MKSIFGYNSAVIIYKDCIKKGDEDSINTGKVIQESGLSGSDIEIIQQTRSFIDDFEPHFIISLCDAVLDDGELHTCLLKIESESGDVFCGRNAWDALSLM